MSLCHVSSTCIADIPPTIIVDIFSFLDAVDASVASTVCRSIRSFALVGVHEFRSTVFLRTLDRTGICRTLNRFPSLCQMELRGCKHFDDLGAFYLTTIPLAEHFTRLDLSRTSVTDRGVETIASVCTSLTTLQLAYCSKVTDWSIPLLVRRCPMLEFLDVGSTGIGSKSLHALTASCSVLSHLNLAWCSKGIFDDASLGALASMTSLVSIALPPTVSDTAFVHIVSCATQLTRLALVNSVITDAVWSEACRLSFPSLQFLTLSHCPNITDSGLISLCTSRCISSLTSIHLWSSPSESFVTDNGISAIVRHCTNLTDINIRRCHLVSDNAMDSIAVHLGKRLRTLTLENIPRVTPVGIATIQAHCKVLENFCVKH